ncbi:hypothetical protein ACWCQ0_42960 [Streptomyces massasporeus]|uniref:hypothetical protein n=1 Tax=Streptomyces massasporeus TaxID=67324 RepID=UPI00340543CE
MNTTAPRRTQVLSLLAVAPLLALLMFRLRDVFRDEVAAALPDATEQEVSLGTWAAVAAGSVLNVLVYTAGVLLIAAATAGLCRGLGCDVEFRRLRHLVGGVFALYLVARTVVLVALTFTPVPSASLMDWSTRPDPGLLLLALATGWVLRKAAPELGALRAAGCAIAPPLLLALAQIAL